LALATSAVRVARGGFANLLQRTIESRLLFALCLAGTIVAGLIAYSRMIAEDVRYLAPMVSLVVLLLAWSLVTLRSRWLTAVSAAGGQLGRHPYDGARADSTARDGLVVFASAAQGFRRHGADEQSG
jgi:hypothetical protein